MDASVVICTFNGAQRLRKTLSSLQRMSVQPQIAWEVVVVDNNSSDNTKDVVNDFAGTSVLEVRYVFEPNQGLSWARNRGFNSARANIIAFTDDDCIVDEKWLTTILREFLSDPTLSGLGGRVELYDPNDRPVSIRISKERTLLSSPYQLFSLLPGCNMAFARTVFEAVGDFDENFGAGTRIASAEDSDFCYRAYKKGFKLLYSPDVLVYHHHGRMTDHQVYSLNRGYVIGRGAFYCKHILKYDRDVFKLAFREVLNNAKKIIKNLIAQKPLKQNLMNYYYLMLGVTYRLIASRRSIPPQQANRKIG